MDKIITSAILSALEDNDRPDYDGITPASSDPPEVAALKARLFEREKRRCDCAASVAGEAILRASSRSGKATR